MSEPDDISRVIHGWGDGDIGPMNGAVGQGVTDAVFDLIRTRAGVETICDLGCGGGYLAGRLGQAGYRVEGVDGSDLLVATANAHHASDRVRFRQGLFGESLAQDLAREQLFDMVVSVDVIEHLYRPRTLIETAVRVLKPGGHLILCTPYHGYLKNLAIALLGRWDSHHGVHWDGGHVKFFSTATLTEIVENPFAIERFVYHGRWPGFWKNMILVATKRA